MAGQEGVIKFSLNYTEEECITPDQVVEIDSWRHILHRLELIGQVPVRYQGFGFGNISVRAGENSDNFLITGTQTGGQQYLQACDYALVTGCSVTTNTIICKGLTRPSSEALTHGQLYQLDSAVNCVVHAHSPDIWKKSGQLQLPTTSADAEYGTAAMAREVERLFIDAAVSKNKIFTMGGHEDGVVSFGASLDEACTVMITVLARAIMCR